MSEDESPMTRRAFIVGGSTVVTVGAVPQGVTAGSVEDPWDHKPRHVVVEFEERMELIEKFQPYLLTAHLDIKPERTYAAYFSSPEEDLDCIAFWHYYATQVGWVPGGADSHYIDREPVYVYIDPAREEVVEIHYSGYHYLIARDDSPEMLNETHPVLHVVHPHNHHLRPRGEWDEEDGEFPPLHEFVPTMERWYANEWEAEPRIVLNPWESFDRDSWWLKSETAFGLITWSPREMEVKWSLRLIRLNPFRDVVTDVE